MTIRNRIDRIYRQFSRRDHRPEDCRAPFAMIVSAGTPPAHDWPTCAGCGRSLVLEIEEAIVTAEGSGTDAGY